MRFEIKATSNRWSCDNLLDQYPGLSEFNYEILRMNDLTVHFVTVNTLEELLKLNQAVGCELIVRSGERYSNYIEIYDDYRE